MAHPILKREGGWRDRMRSYRVLINGIEVERLRPKSAAHIEVDEGIRRVQLKIDGCGSPIQSVLFSHECPAVLRCCAGSADARAIYAGRALSEDYIFLENTNAEDCARSYLRAASRAAAYAASQNARTGHRSRFELTDGDLSVLFHACRRPDTIVGTREGSANHVLWSELAKIGWMQATPVPCTLPIRLVNFRLSDYGRIELLDIF